MQSASLFPPADDSVVPLARLSIEPYEELLVFQLSHCSRVQMGDLFLALLGSA